MIKIDTLTRLAPSKVRLRHSRRHAQLSHLNLTLNLSIFSFVLSLAFLPHLPPLLSSFTVPLPASCLGLRQLPEIPLFCFQPKACVVEPKATSPTSTEPCAPRSLNHSFAPPFPRFISCGCDKPLLVHCHWSRQNFLSHAKAPTSLWHGFSFKIFNCSCSLAPSVTI